MTTRSDQVTEETCRIGVISDTHGYLDPSVVDIFTGVDLILHAGDVGDAEILEQLRSVAPVVAVSGNLDDGQLADLLPSEASGSVGCVRFVVGHKRKRLVKRLAAGKLDSGEPPRPPDLVVLGHEHAPTVSWSDSTLFLNPGSAAAPYEEDEMPTVALVEASAAGLSVCFVPLTRRSAEALRQGGPEE